MHEEPSRMDGKTCRVMDWEVTRSNNGQYDNLTLDNVTSTLTHTWCGEIKEYVMAERLPDEYGAMLRQAALTANTRDDPFACDRAIEEAIEFVKTKFPNFFRSTEENCYEDKYFRN